MPSQAGTLQNHIVATTQHVYCIHNYCYTQLKFNLPPQQNTYIAATRLVAKLIQYLYYLLTFETCIYFFSFAQLRILKLDVTQLALT